MLRPARLSLSPSSSQSRRLHYSLAKQWALEEFVVLPENECAWKASCTLLRKPGSLPAPLVFWGPAGVGKTHLARGLGTRFCERTNRARTATLSAVDYAEDVAKAARANELPSLRARYASLDLLVLDGLESVAGKTWLQQELLRTFDALRARGVTMVYTARTPPARLTGLSARLRSQLASGVTVSAGLPGEASRRRLLGAFSDRLQISLSPEICCILAKGLPGSARDLLDALTVLNAAAEEDEGPITAALAKRYVTIQGGQCCCARLSAIAEAVASYFDVTVPELVSARRSQPVTRGRQAAIYLARQLTSRSLVEIGRFFGGRDHSTVLYSCRRVAQGRQQDRELDAALNQVVDALRSGT